MNEQFRRTKIAASISLATALAAGAIQAQAQEQAAAQQGDEEYIIEEVVVIGYRQALMDAISMKRDSTSIVEAISAEDIGKLPDNSIGESLARLPGLAAQRFDGRANKISIRGLAPDFTTTMLNGRELVSSDTNRAVEYDQFPSELITGAVVYKTPDAALTAQAVGGTVDMLTVRPLNYQERVVALGLRGELADEGKLNSDTKDTGYRANLAWIDQNDAGTVGWALGLATMFQPIQEEYIHAWGYENFTDADGQSGEFINGIKPYVKTNELERDGFLGVVEFNPDDRIHGRIDAFYSKFDDEQTLRGAEIAGYTGSRDIISVGPDGLVTEGQWTGLQTQSRNDFSYRNVETRAIGFNLKYNPNEAWEIETDLSYSDAEREYTAYETYMAVIRGMGRPGDTGDTFNYRLGEGNGLVVDTDVDFSDPNVWQLGDNLGWGGVLCTEADGWQCDSQDGFVNSETSDDDLTAFKLAATHFVEGELIQSVTVGARYAERTKGHSKVGQFMMLPEYPDLVPIPEQYLRAPTNLGFVGLGDIVSYDPRGLVRDGFYVYRVESDISQALNDWTVNEDVANIYAMADIMSGKWSGNFGVQAVYTDQSSTGTQTGITPAGVEFVEVTLGDSFWELLPSVNLAYDINDSYKLRLGAARVLARPRMDQMRASLEFNFDENKINNTDIEDSPWGGNGGNPELKPWMAWQFDVSLETYFGAAGYAALSAYYKDLENYVYDKRILTDFSAAIPLIPEEFRPVLSEGFYTAPENGKGGWIRGVEFSASLPFDLFNENLRSFGAFVSASWTDSEVQEDADSAPLQLPGLSETVINGTVYYENDAGFAARISARQRDKFLAEAFAIGLSREETIAKKETVVDAQLSMDMERFGWEGLSFYLQGQNLTNEPFVQYLDDNPTKFKNYHTYGRSYLAGFNFRM